MMSSSSRRAVAQQALLRRAATADGAGSRSSAVVVGRTPTSSGRAASFSSSSSLKVQRPALILRGGASAWARCSAIIGRRLYSTEQVLKLRGSTIDTTKTKILYNAKDEKDNCGVGLIANLKSIPSRHVVEAADEMLVRMSHRGGVGVDPASGDGAGTYNIVEAAAAPFCWTFFLPFFGFFYSSPFYDQASSWVCPTLSCDPRPRRRSASIFHPLANTL